MSDEMLSLCKQIKKLYAVEISQLSCSMIKLCDEENRLANEIKEQLDADMGYCRIVEGVIRRRELSRSVRQLDTSTWD